ncbi:MAG: ligase-associated DNA damage response endonuclease PdeM [Chloroflexota bacterium]
MTDAKFEVAGETLTLMPERAIYWERNKTLLIADPHFGKSATFRAHGIPIPEGNLNSDLARLTQAITRTGADKVIVLGDLLHTVLGRDDETLGSVQMWREQHPDLQITLVRGNHDRHAGDPPDVWQMQCVDAPITKPPFVLTHQPEPSADGYVLAGHLHPLALLEGKGKQSLKLPCFWFGTEQAILPAFGSFIDGMVVRTVATDRVFVVTPGSVQRI